MLLLVASLCFYATFKPAYVLLLLGITVIAYAGARGIETAADQRTKKAILVAAVVAVLGSLLVVKYLDFFAGSIEALLRAGGLHGSAGVLPRLGLAAATGLSF